MNTKYLHRGPIKKTNKKKRFYKHTVRLFTVAKTRAKIAGGKTEQHAKVQYKKKEKKNRPEKNVHRAAAWRRCRISAISPGDIPARASSAASCSRSQCPTRSAYAALSGNATTWVWRSTSRLRSLQPTKSHQLFLSNLKVQEKKKERTDTSGIGACSPPSRIPAEYAVSRSCAAAPRRGVAILALPAAAVPAVAPAVAPRVSVALAGFGIQVAVAVPWGSYRRTRSRY